MTHFFLAEQDFNPFHTFYCGQIFRVEKIADDVFEVKTTSYRCRTIMNAKKGGWDIYSNNEEYFKSFFDVSRNYAEIKQRLQKYPALKEGMKFGYGIRILKSNLFEMIVSFITSQNNNISRIRGLLNNLSQAYGSKCKDDFGTFCAFPTLSQLKKVREEDYKAMGFGYRSRYLAKTIAALNQETLNELSHLNTQDARNKLLTFCGIGGKVADCILLFGLARNDVFPVDVWVERVFNNHFKKEGKNVIKTREQMRNFFVHKFGKDSGLAQQYLFFYQREAQKQFLIYI